jgi:WD40 repeat protein
MSIEMESAADEHGPQPRVFISYSRKDIEFADRLQQALSGRGFEVLIDRSEILALEVWWKRIEDLISESDTVIFILSPDSVRSAVGLKEVKFAASLKKRFAPIVWRSVDDIEIPEALAQLNFIFFDKPEAFDNGLQRLCDALVTDIEWIRKHTEFGQYARRWYAAERPGPRGLLLRPPLLEEAERWIASHPADAPEPTDLTKTFLTESRRAETRRQRLLFGASLVVALVAVVLATWAEVNRREAEQQRVEAVRQRNQALRSQSYFLASTTDREASNGDPTYGALIALEGLPNPDATSSPAKDRPYVAAVERSLYRSLDRPERGRILAGQGTEASSVACTADGLVVAAGSNNGRVLVWDASTGNLKFALSGHSGPVGSVKFSDDGRLLATASEDGTARIWNLANGSASAVLTGHSKRVTGAVFNTDASTVTTASTDATLRRWDTGSGRQISSVPLVGRGAIESIDLIDANQAAVVFHGDAKEEYSRSYGSYIRDEVVLTNLTRGNHVRLFRADGRPGVPLVDPPDIRHGDDIWSIDSFVRDSAGKRMIVADDRDGAEIKDVASRDTIAPLQGYVRGKITLSFDDKGTRIIGVTEDGIALLWGSETGRQLWNLSSDKSPVTAASFCGGDGAVATASKDGTVQLWGSSRVSLQTKLDFSDDEVAQAAFDGNGDRIATLSSTGTFSIWSTTTGGRIATTDGVGGQLLKSLSGRGQSRFAVAAKDGTVPIWDAQTGKQLTVLQAPTSTSALQGTQAIAFSKDRARAFTADDDETVRIWNVESGELIRTIETGISSNKSIALTPDERAVVVGWGWFGGPSGPYERGGGYTTWPLDGTAEQASKHEIEQPVVGATTSPETGRLLVTRVKQQKAGLETDPDNSLLLSSEKDALDAFFLSDGDRLLAFSNRQIAIYDGAAHESVAAIETSADILDVVERAGGKTMLIVTKVGAVMERPLFHSRGSIVKFAQNTIDRCLDLAERTALQLEPEPPDWCFMLGKWPYNSEDWKHWLALKGAGIAAPLPGSTDWDEWVEQHSSSSAGR